MIDNFCAPIAAVSTCDNRDFITAWDQSIAVIFCISKLCEHQLLNFSSNMKNYYTENIEIYKFWELPPSQLSQGGINQLRKAITSNFEWNYFI